MVYLLLFLEFFKTGLFAIGGGLATLPFLYDLAAKYTWFDEAILADMIAISESTPGPIGVNMATYAGYNAGHAVGGVWGGILGGVIATSALVLPSIIIIVIIAKFLAKFQENKLVKQAFYGLRPAVCALIAAAGWQVLKTCIFTFDAYAQTGSLLDLFNWKGVILFVILMILTNIKKLKCHPIVYIAGAAVVGIVFKF